MGHGSQPVAVGQPAGKCPPRDTVRKPNPHRVWNDLVSSSATPRRITPVLRAAWIQPATRLSASLARVAVYRPRFLLRHAALEVPLPAACTQPAPAPTWEQPPFRSRFLLRQAVVGLHPHGLKPSQLPPPRWRLFPNLVSSSAKPRGNHSFPRGLYKTPRVACPGKQMTPQNAGPVWPGPAKISFPPPPCRVDHQPSSTRLFYFCTGEGIRRWRPQIDI